MVEGRGLESVARVAIHMARWISSCEDHRVPCGDFSQSCQHLVAHSHSLLTLAVSFCARDVHSTRDHRWTTSPTRRIRRGCSDRGERRRARLHFLLYTASRVASLSGGFSRFASFSCRTRGIREPLVCGPLASARRLRSATYSINGRRRNELGLRSDADCPICGSAVADRACIRKIRGHASSTIRHNGSVCSSPGSTPMRLEERAAPALSMRARTCRALPSANASTA